MNETFLTTLDKTSVDQTVINNKTLNLTMYTANDQSTVIDRDSRHKDQLIDDLRDQIAEVESIWKHKCATL